MILNTMHFIILQFSMLSDIALYNCFGVISLGENNLTYFNSERDELKTKIIDLETRTMRDKLMFYGLQETIGENCETIIQKFCTEKLNLDGSKLKFDRVHRVGGQTARKPRPIVTKFHYYSERETVLNTAYEQRGAKKRNINKAVLHESWYTLTDCEKKGETRSV